MAISDKLEYLNDTKGLLKQKINNLGGSIDDNTTFRNYANQLQNVYDNLPKTEYQEGTEINLGKTSKGKLDFEDGVVSIGKSSQDGTPAPSQEIPIECATGNQDVVVESGNVLTNATWTNGKYLNSNDEEIDNAGWKYTDYINIGQDEWIYRPSAVANAPKSILYDVNKNKIAVLDVSNTTYNLSNYNNAYYIRVSASTSSSPELYITPKAYQLSLGDIELNAIGNYKDELIYDVDEDKVYKKEKIGKVILNGSENWVFNSTSTLYVHTGITEGYQTDFSIAPLILSNYYISNDFSSLYSASEDYGISYGASSTDRFCIRNADITSVADFKTWLSTHNVSVYYILKNAVETELTDTTLKAQVKALYNAHSNNGTTIITSNGNLHMIIKVRGLKGE